MHCLFAARIRIRSINRALALRWLVARRLIARRPSVLRWLHRRRFALRLLRDCRLCLLVTMRRRRLLLLVWWWRLVSLLGIGLLLPLRLDSPLHAVLLRL